MLHKYCGGHSNGCSCGFLHGACGGGASYSIPFQANKPGVEEHGSYLSPPSTVDCTLSLGTPSTRQTSYKPPMNRSISWNIISEPGKHASHGTSGGDDESYFTNLGGDPLLLARRCANCDTTSTPLWRNGPRGPKSLCNACGIRYKKEERRGAAASPSRSSSSSSMAGAAARGPQHAWSCHDPPAAGAFGVDGDENREAAYLLPWRLNVVHTWYETRSRKVPAKGVVGRRRRKNKSKETNA